jgi:hypothetical protein
MHGVQRSLLVLAAVAAGAGCGKSASDAGTTAAQACADLAAAECAKRVSCSNAIDPVGISIVHNFGTSAECLTRLTAMCTAALAAPDTGSSPALVEECATALPMSSCSSFYLDDPPAPCAPTGPRANGQPCAFNGQCMTGLCADAKNARCGTCAALPAVGAPCASSLCAHGQVCDVSTLTCKTPGASGGSCDDANACGYGLSCVAAGDAATARMCQPAVEMLGAACGGTMSTCDPAQGLFCNGPVGSKTCVKIAYVGDGKTCGFLAGGGYAACVAGNCYTANALAGSGETGTCKGDVLDGSPCDAVVGPAA